MPMGKTFHETTTPAEKLRYPGLSLNSWYLKITSITLKLRNTAWRKTLRSWCRCLSNYRGQGHISGRDLLCKDRYVFSSFLCLCLLVPTAVKTSWSLATERNTDGTGCRTSGTCSALPPVLLRSEPSHRNPQSSADYSQENHSFWPIRLRARRFITFQSCGESARDLSGAAGCQRKASRRKKSPGNSSSMLPPYLQNVLPYIYEGIYV